MSRPLAATLLAASAALAAPVPKDKGEAGLYFPTKEGAKRVTEMKVDGTTIELTETVTKVEVKDGKHTVTVEQAVAEGQGLVGSSGVFEVTDKGVFGLTGGEKEAGDPQPLLKLGAKAGDTWTSELRRPHPGGPRVIETTYTMRKEEVVVVPAGRYTALRVDYETDQGGFTTKGTTWFAVGVGVVRREWDQGGKKMTQELKAFTPGKAGVKKIDERK